MANPLRNEEALYEIIRSGKISVPLSVWDAMYHFLGDYVSYINLQASYYIEQDKAIPVEEAGKMLDYVMRSMSIVHKIIYPERIRPEDVHLQKVKNERAVLNPLIKEFYTHYLGNDLHIIGMCIQLYLDPQGSEPIPVADARKILNATLSIRKFLDRLREATLCPATSPKGRP